LNCDKFSNDLFPIFISQFWPAFWSRVPTYTTFSLCLLLDQPPY
jgi:hypothetical protein